MVPIFYDMSEEEIRARFAIINGLLLPGAPAPLLLAMFFPPGIGLQQLGSGWSPDQVYSGWVVRLIMGRCRLEGRRFAAPPLSYHRLAVKHWVLNGTTNSRLCHAMPCCVRTFAGGGASLKPGHKFYDAASLLVELAIEANDNGDYFPVSLDFHASFHLWVCLLVARSLASLHSLHGMSAAVASGQAGGSTARRTASACCIEGEARGRLHGPPTPPPPSTQLTMQLHVRE